MQESPSAQQPEARPVTARFPSNTRSRQTPLSAFRKLLTGQAWIETAAKSIQPPVASAGKAVGVGVMDAVHGTWLAHPLHPVLTDVPLGSATVAMALDLTAAATQQQALERGADAALAMSVAGAVPTAVAGLADWSHTRGDTRRAGFIHALMNTIALTLNIASVISRFSGRRKAGVALSSTAYLVSTGAAWLGGTLVYEQGMGVDHNFDKRGPVDFTQVMPESEVREGQTHQAEVEGVSILLFRQGGEVFAIGERCAHMGGPLSEGQVNGNLVVCPWHGSTYSLRDGALVHGPSVFHQPCFQVRIWNGQVYVRRAPDSQTS